MDTAAGTADLIFVGPNQTVEVTTQVMLRFPSFEDFYRTNRTSIGRALAMTLRDTSLATEAIDEAMARAFQRWPHVSQLDNPGGWVYRVGLNWSRSVIRRLTRPAPVWVAAAGSSPAPSVQEPLVDRALGHFDRRPARRRGVPAAAEPLRSTHGRGARHQARHREEPPPPRARTPRPATRASAGGTLMNSDPTPDQVPDHSVARQLADQAARLDVGAPMLEVVMQRGHQRQQRRRTALGVMAVTSVCAATIVSINVLSRPADHGHAVTAPIVDDSTPNDTPPNGTGASTTAHLVDSTLVWNRVDPDAAEALSLFSGYNTDRIAGDGPFVALVDGAGAGHRPAERLRTGAVAFGRRPVVAAGRRRAAGQPGQRGRARRALHRLRHDARRSRHPPAPAPIWRWPPRTTGVSPGPPSTCRSTSAA